MRIVQISDLHFGAVAAGLPQGLRQAIEAVRPEWVVVSGDLSQHGTAAEMAEAKAYLDALQPPKLIIPGNHDIPHGLRLWQRFRHPWKDWQRAVQPETEPTLSLPDAEIVGMNSVRPGGWYLDWSRGQLSPRQLLRLRSRFKGVPADRLRVLVVHHPPAAPPQGTKRHLIDNRRALFAALNHAGVDLILSGHFHLSYATPISLPGAIPRSCVLSVASTATSHRLQGEPNGFHEVGWNGHQLRITAHTWQGGDYKSSRRWCFERDEERQWREGAEDPP